MLQAWLLDHRYLVHKDGSAIYAAVQECASLGPLSFASH